MEALVVVEEATETQDYMLIGVNHEEGVLKILESSVKEKADWDDEEKVEEKEMSEPVPAAG